MAQPLQTSSPLTNAEIADRLAALAQLLTLEKANPYKIRAYRRAADMLRSMGDSVDDLVREDADLRELPGVGSGISAAIREIVLTGKLATLEKLRDTSSPELSAITAFPRLDPRRVLRIYKKLGISSVDELRSALESGDLERALGPRAAQHVKQSLVDTEAILLYHAHKMLPGIEDFLLKRARATRVAAAGEYRRCVDIITEFSFVVEAADFAAVVAAVERFGGRTPLVESTKTSAVFSLQNGPLLRLQLAHKRNWGLALIRQTGSKAHLRKLTAVTGSLAALEKSAGFPDEQAFYKKFGMQFIPPELREGHDEVRLARAHRLPTLITVEDIRGDLHAHTFASDGVDSIEEMAVAARERSYDYVGITDHSISLKIANGLSVERLRKQIHAIDKLNGKLGGIRILKSAEVDILADGSLDYPDEILRELDYTVCSIHSRFAMNKAQQTERVLRAMDNRYFTILGHATGRLLLKRPGYELDFQRVVDKAKQNGCFFELNCSPDRLDLRAEHARIAREAGVLLAISTDSHSTAEYATIRHGIEQARRAGVTKHDVLNSKPLEAVLKLFKR